jgi:hypothetical protein
MPSVVRRVAKMERTAEEDALMFCYQVREMHTACSQACLVQQEAKEQQTDSCAAYCFVRCCCSAV